MRFADIPGHQYEKQRLRALVDEERMPHALLLGGASGIGKFMLARALAAYIHCTARTPDGDSCGECPSCRQHRELNHIDTFYSYPVLKKDGTTISRDYLEEWSEFLEKSPFMDFEQWLARLGNTNGQPVIYKEEAVELIYRLSRTARQSKYKIVLMWLPERMNETASNKLLKLIEEPADDTLFIFTSDNPAAILPTIYSRTQRIGVKSYSEEELRDILTQRYRLDGAEAAMAASLGEGSVTEALRARGTDRTQKLYLDLFINLMRKAYTRKVGELRDWADEVARLKREGSMRFYEYCARLVRENFIMNIGVSRLNSMSEEEKAFSVRFSPFINVYNVQSIFDVLTAARNDTAANGNPKIIAFDLAVKIILLIKRGQEKK